jgi:hypothetical protein
MDVIVPVTRRRLSREPVVFIRIVMATTGIVTVVSGLFLVAVALWRVNNPAPAVVPLPRALTVIFSFTFLLSFLLKGVCWVMVALSPRLWDR